jgi:two-component system, NtrC family, nitrogen regulation sensor histidine kinase NtrY
MASKPAGAALFSLGLAVRGFLVAALGASAIAVGAAFHFYATALVIAAAAGLVFVSLVQAVGRGDRMLARFATSAAAGDFDRAGRDAGGFRGLAAAIDRAAAGLQARRAQTQARLDFLDAIADSVSAALIVIESDGSARLANRAARELARDSIARLADIALLQPKAAARIGALKPGGREIIQLTDGREMLASAVQFRVGGDDPSRLVALMPMGELDAVELRAWRNLVRVLAHEMMNSLTPIASLAESLAVHADEPETIAAAVEVIGRRSHGLMNFVDHYRQVAEMPRPELTMVAVAELAASVERLLEPSRRAASVEFQVVVDPPELVVTADAALLEQALINLLKNATEAVANRDGARIRLSCRVADASVEIAVADNGPGLTPAARESLFVPFFTTKAGGSGIGLSIARQIALAHDGQLDAAANPDGGATFTLRIPRK